MSTKPSNAVESDAEPSGEQDDEEPCLCETTDLGCFEHYEVDR